MNIKFAEKRLALLCAALEGVGLPIASLETFSGGEDEICRDIDLFNLKIPDQESGQYGVRMCGLGIMTIIGHEPGGDPIDIRKVTSVNQVVDILLSFAQNELNSHLMRAAA
jgi:hypothetical protein